MKRKDKPEGVINRVYKYKLKPRPVQVSAMTEMLRTQCYLYNRALEYRIKQYEDGKKSVSLGDLKKTFITEARKENEFLAACNYGLCAQTLTRLDLAYKSFFRRVKMGQEAPGFPKFASAYKWNTLGFDSYGNGCRIKGNRLYVQGVGEVKVHLYRPLPENASLRNIAVTRQPDGWFVCITLEMPAHVPPPRPEGTESKVIGIDAGVRAFVMDSDGQCFAPARHYAKAKASLAKAQVVVSRRVKGSARRRESVRLLAKKSLHVARQRKEWHRLVAKELCLKAAVIVREELEIVPMVKRPAPVPDALGTKGQFLPNGAAQAARLHMGILDAAWGEFFATLDLAGEKYGSLVVPVAAAYTSQTCSICGKVQEPLIDVLTTSRFDCKFCGHSADIDLNAALIIRERGMAVMELVAVAAKELAEKELAKEIAEAGTNAGDSVL